MKLFKNFLRETLAYLGVTGVLLSSIYFLDAMPR